MNEFEADLLHVETQLAAARKLMLKAEDAYLEARRDPAKAAAVEQLRAAFAAAEGAVARLIGLRDTLADPGAPDHLKLIASLARSVDRLVSDDTVEGWAELAMEEARRAAIRRLDGAEERLAVEALDALKPLAGAMARQGKASLRAALERLAGGDQDGAREVWLAPDATWRERLIALRDMTVVAASESDATELDWRAFCDVLEAIGAGAVKALPFLVSALA